jgi:uroporphyrinogen III methyltransferase/synthase
MADKPLQGRTVVVTRAAAQAEHFVDLLRAHGASVIEAPTIAIDAPSSWAALDAALDALQRYTWIVFTSVNGVMMVDRRLRERGHGWTALSGKRVAAIGPATADALAGRGVRTDVVPSEFRAEALVERLRPELRPDDRVLLPRAAKTRDHLVTELRRLVAEVTEVAAYSTRRVDGDGTRLRAALTAHAVDVVTFTSSSTARNFAELFSVEERRDWLSRVVVAAIGPVTAATAAEYGLRTDVMPSEYTIPALARAIAEHFGQRGGDAPALGPESRRE